MSDYKFGFTGFKTGQEARPDVVVPEGMLEAAEKAGRDEDGFVANNLRTTITAALRWQRDNPPVPTDAQYTECLRATDKPGSMVVHLYEKGEPQKAIAEWIRRMYDAKSSPRDNPTVERIVEGFRGVTLSRAEAGYIIDQLNMVTHG